MSRRQTDVGEERRRSCHGKGLGAMSTVEKSPKRISPNFSAAAGKYVLASLSYLSGEHKRLFVDALFEHRSRLIWHVLLYYLETKEPTE